SGQIIPGALQIRPPQSRSEQEIFGTIGAALTNIGYRNPLQQDRTAVVDDFRIPGGITFQMSGVDINQVSETGNSSDSHKTDLLAVIRAEIGDRVIAVVGYEDKAVNIPAAGQEIVAAIGMKFVRSGCANDRIIASA